MNLQQLQYVVEIVKHGNNLSAAAKALNTSQPGVSRQIQLLELELGFPIFRRTRNRIIELTENGMHVLAVAQRISADVAVLRTLGSDMSSGNRGTLTIGTTHTQARYVLPKVIEGFVRRYPHVHIVLKQGVPEEICAQVESGEADFAMGPQPTRDFPNLVQLRCFELSRSVVARRGHPIFDHQELTIETVAEYPIVTYDPRYGGRRIVMEPFWRAGLEPKTILSAIDVDVCKTYVELGLGVAILTTVAYDEERDIHLQARDASHLFGSNRVNIYLRPSTYLRPFLVDFICSITPEITKALLRKSLFERSPS